MSKISVSALTTLRERMTAGSWWINEYDGSISADGGDVGPSDFGSADTEGMLAIVNAVPALLGLAKAVLELEATKVELAAARDAWRLAQDTYRSAWPPSWPLQFPPGGSRVNPLAAARDLMLAIEDRFAQCQTAYDTARAAVSP